MTASSMACPPPAFTRDYLSYSSIALYQACPLRFWFKYVVGLPEETVAASLVFGAAFHAAVQHHYQQLLVDGVAPGLDVLFDVFWDAWHERDGDHVVFSHHENLDTVARLIYRMLPVFGASAIARPSGKIIGIEEELRASVVPGCPDLLARLDLLVETGDTLLILDFKTARCRWNPAKIFDAAPQLHLYAELATPLAEGKPLHLAFAVMTKAKRRPVLTLHTVPHDPREVGATLRLVQTTWQAIQRRKFEPQRSPIHCPQCPYRARCDAWP